MSETVRELYSKGQEKLAGAGIHDAAFDARELLSFIIGVPFRDIPLHYADEVPDGKQAEYDALLGRRMSGEPLQYITGEQEFMGLSFHVDERVLIPRLDTEILAEEAINYINAASYTAPDQIRVLDLCCGSGAVGLSIAALADNSHDGPYTGDETAVEQSTVCNETAAGTAPGRLQVVLSDISHDALDVARENAEALGAAQQNVEAPGQVRQDVKAPGILDRVEFIQSDLFGNIDGVFSLIVSNPPYIRSDVIETLDEEVRGHEPMLALDGGPDGLDVYRRIVRDAPEHLKTDGCLMMEIGMDQAEKVAKLLRADFRDIAVKKDLAGLDRVITARKA